MAGFLFRLETADGAAADPPTVARPDWPVGSMIHSGGRTLRVIGRRDDDVAKALILVVEETAAQAPSAAGACDGAGASFRHPLRSRRRFQLRIEQVRLNDLAQVIA